MDEITKIASAKERAKKIKFVDDEAPSMSVDVEEGRGPEPMPAPSEQTPYSPMTPSSANSLYASPSVRANLEEPGDHYGESGEAEPKKLTRKFGFRAMFKSGKGDAGPTGRKNKDLLSKFSKSRFKHWTRGELIDVLISEGIELRAESMIQTITLRDLCESVFAGLPIPEKVPPLNDKQLLRREMAAIRIQQNYLDRQWRLRQEQEDMHDLEDEEEEEAEAVADAELVDYASPSEDMDEDAVEPMLSTDDVEAQVRPPSKRTLAKSKRILSSRTLKVLDMEWTPPDWQKAADAANFTQIRKGGKGGTPFHMHNTTTGRHCFLSALGEQCDLWQEGMISEFSIFGPGISNYFKFLKWLYWLFAMLVIITIPELIINIYGTSSDSQGLSDLAQTTVGNLANTVINGTISIPLPGCSSAVFGASNCVLNRSSLGVFYAVLDIILSSFTLVAFTWLWVFERREEKKVEALTKYTSQYTVAVKDLPPDITVPQLREHFHNLLEGKILVRAIELAVDSMDHIELLAQRGSLLQRKTRMVHYHRYEVTMAKKKHTDPEAKEKAVRKIRDKFASNCKQTDRSIRDLEKFIGEVEKKPERPVVAFVTFEHMVAALIVRDMYEIKLVDRLFSMLCMCGEDPKLARLKINGKMPTISKAAEPSTIIWENLGVSQWERYGRRLLTVILAILLVIISVIVTYGAKALQQRALASGGTSLCPPDFSSLTRAEQVSMVTDDPDILHCYCDQFNTLTQENDKLCKDYAINQVKAQVLTFFASFVVLCVGTFIEAAIRRFADFERHHSEDTKEKSIFIRLFFLQYLNTSCVFLINNNHKLLQDIFGTSSAASNDFTAAWYQSVGVSVLLVQCGNILSAQSNTIYAYAMYYFTLARAKASTTSCITQSELNKIHIGPRFELAFRYASLLSTFFVVMTFNAGMPLLNVIAVCFYALYYYMDKYTFIKLYRAPHRYNSEIGKVATMFIPLAVLLHLGFSIWMLSNPEIFSYGASNSSNSITSQTDNLSLSGDISEKIGHLQTFPLFVLLVLICIVYFLYYFSKFVSQIARKIRTIVEGTVEEQAEIKTQMEEFKDGVSVAFSKAIRRNIISGLSSYNILQNPRYKEAFGISWKFAMTHRHLKDVKNSTFVENHDDDDIIKAHKGTKTHFLSDRVVNSSSAGSASGSGRGGSSPSVTRTQMPGIEMGRQGGSTEIDFASRSGSGSGKGPGGKKKLDRQGSHYMRNKILADQVNGQDDDEEEDEVEGYTPHDSESARTAGEGQPEAQVDTEYYSVA